VTVRTLYYARDRGQEFVICIQCGSVVYWLGRRTPGLVFERSRVQLPAGALPGRVGQLSLPSPGVGI